QGQAREPGHGDGVVISVGRPVAILLLVLGEPIQTLADILFVLLGNLIGACWADQSHDDAQGGRHARKRLDFQHVTAPRTTIPLSPRSGSLTGRRSGSHILTAAAGREYAA